MVICRGEDLAALTRLRHAGWRLGVVTNGMLDNQSRKIRRTGLDAVVQGWAISDDFGVANPIPTSSSTPHASADATLLTTAG